MKKRVESELYKRRNITISDEWQFFVNFLADMGERPEGTTLDRIDNNQGYFKENCRWANSKVQARNKFTNHFLEINGISKCLVDWAKEFNLPTTTFYRRFHRGERGEFILRPSLHQQK